MAKEPVKRKAKKESTATHYKVEIPKLPTDFRGAQYGNKILMSASAEEIFFDLFQLGPETGGSGEGSIIFVGRFIFPLALVKTVISRLQNLVGRIEKDLQIELPGPEELGQ